MSTAMMIASSRRSAQTGFKVAWGFWLPFYFGQYAIVAATLDRYGAKHFIPIGFVVTAIGAVWLARAVGVSLNAPITPIHDRLLNELAGGGELTKAAPQNTGSVGIAGIVPAFFLRETGASVVKVSP